MLRKEEYATFEAEVKGVQEFDPQSQSIIESCDTLARDESSDALEARECALSQLTLCETVCLPSATPDREPEQCSTQEQDCGRFRNDLNIIDPDIVSGGAHSRRKSEGVGPGC